MAKNEYQFGQARTSGPVRGPIRIAEKPKDMRGSVRMLARYLEKQRFPLCAAWTCAVASVMLTLFAPNSLNLITTCIEQGMASGNLDTGTLVSISVRVLLIYLFSSLLIYTQSITLVHTTQNIMHSMRSDIDGKLNRIPLSRFDSASFGDLLSRVTNDVDTIGMSLNHSATEIVTAIVTFLGVCALRILWVLFVFPQFPTTRALLFCFPVSWSVTAVIYAVYYSWYRKNIICITGGSS